MSSYLDLQQQVARDLRRSNLGPEIASAIVDAIRDHDSERFFFNESETYEFNTVPGTDTYQLPPQPPIQEFIRIDVVRAQIGNTWYSLDRKTPDEIEYLFSVPTSGQPYDYRIHGDAEMKFFPTPNQIFPIQIYGHYRLIPLALDSDSNGWTNQAKNLIRYSALKRLFFYPIRDGTQTQIAEAAELRELEYLRRETERRVRRGQMEPYY